MINFASVLKAAGFNVPDKKVVTPKRLLAILKEYREFIERTNCNNVEMTMTRDQNGKTIITPKYIDTDAVLEINPSIESNELVPQRLELSFRDYVTGRSAVTIFRIDPVATLEGDLSDDEVKLAVLVSDLSKNGLLNKVTRYYGPEEKPIHAVENNLRIDGRWSSKIVKLK